MYNHGVIPGYLACVAKVGGAEEIRKKWMESTKDSFHMHNNYVNTGNNNVHNIHNTHNRDNRDIYDYEQPQLSRNPISSGYYTPSIHTYHNN